MSKLSNILDEYEKLKTDEAVSKSSDSEDSTVEQTENQVSESDLTENQKPEKVTEEDSKEAQKQEELLESEGVENAKETAKEEVNNSEDENSESVEKSKKESKDPVDHTDTKTEDKDNEKRKNKKDDKESESDKDDKESKSDKKDKASKSLSDDDIVTGFQTVLKSLQDLNEEKSEFVTKSEFKELSDKLDKVLEDKEVTDNKVEESKEDEDKVETTEKSVTSINQDSNEKAEGFVNKSIDTESEVPEVSEGKSEQVPSQEEDGESEDSNFGLTSEENKVFMDKYKEEAVKPNKNLNYLNQVRQAHYNVNVTPEKATQEDLQIIKDFIK